MNLEAGLPQELKVARGEMPLQLPFNVEPRPGSAKAGFAVS